MMNVLMISTLLLMSSFSAVVVPNEGEIKWSATRLLTYDDFQGKVPGDSPWAALTSSNIYFTYNTTNGKLATFQVYATFKKKESWMKTKNEVILGHEQLHFNIAEIAARKLYLQIDSLRGQSGDIPKQVNDLFTSANAYCDKMQRQYDEETAHGIKPEEQAAWKKKITEMLSLSPQYPPELK